MGAKSRVRAYYDALRNGDPLAPYFAPDEDVVKYGISETLAGYDAIESGLQTQTRTTTDWTVESHALGVTERDRHAWFSDGVTLAWTATDRHIRYEFDTRWSGTLERRSPDSETMETDDGPVSTTGDWRFVGMHVSTAGEL